MDASLSQLAQMTRAEVRAGALRGSAFLDRLLSVPFLERDAWIDALLGIAELPDDVPDLPRDSVPYLPSGVDEILTMVREVPVRSHDELVDLGSGLGRVPILTHLLTGCRARGVELQDPLVKSATRQADELGLTGVSFVHADAAEVPLDGSVFFLYTPFGGEMLNRALSRLEEVARRRPIVVCAVSLELRDVPWLRARKSSRVSLTIYDSSNAFRA